VQSRSPSRLWHVPCCYDAPCATSRAVFEHVCLWRPALVFGGALLRPAGPARASKAHLHRARWFTAAMVPGLYPRHRARLRVEHRCTSPTACLPGQQLAGGRHVVPADHVFRRGIRRVLFSGSMSSPDRGSSHGLMCGRSRRIVLNPRPASRPLPRRARVLCAMLAAPLRRRGGAPPHPGARSFASARSVVGQKVPSRLSPSASMTDARVCRSVHGSLTWKPGAAPREVRRVARMLVAVPRAGCDRLASRSCTLHRACFPCPMRPTVVAAPVKRVRARPPRRPEAATCAPRYTFPSRPRSSGRSRTLARDDCGAPVAFLRACASAVACRDGSRRWPRVGSTPFMWSLASLAGPPLAAASSSRALLSHRRLLVPVAVTFLAPARDPSVSGRCILRSRFRHSSVTAAVLAAFAWPGGCVPLARARLRDAD